MAKTLSLSRRSLKRLIGENAVFLGLDYDGTLAPIVKDPEKARMPSAVKTLLKRLNARRDCRVAIVSGRSLKQLKKMAAVDGLRYIGNHGLEMREGRSVWIHPKARRFRKVRTQIKPRLVRLTHRFPGAYLEDKGLILSLHYRNAAAGQVPALEKAFRAEIRPFVKRAQVRLGRGKKVWELRPNARWHKGKALKRLLSGSVPARGTVLFYAGDDLTDEDAFRSLGRRAVTVYVGPKRKTAARFRVASPAKVHALIGGLWALMKERK